MIFNSGDIISRPNKKYQLRDHFIIYSFGNHWVYEHKDDFQFIDFNKEYYLVTDIFSESDS